MLKFNLSVGSKDVEVTIPSHLELTESDLRGYKPFVEWLTTVEASLQLQETNEKHQFHQKSKQYTLRSILLQSVDWWPTKTGKRIGFLKFDTIMNNEEDSTLPGTIFMRGGSIAVLMIIIPEDSSSDRYVVMTQQPRVPAGSLSFYEIPAGMIDNENNIRIAAAKEIKEETGLDVPTSELKNLTRIALELAKNSEGHLQKAMYPSPGGCDEFITLFAWEKKMAQMDINELKDKLTGVDNEQIRVKLVPYDEVWREGARDAKTLGAWALYEGIKRNTSSGDIGGIDDFDDDDENEEEEI